MPMAPPIGPSRRVVQQITALWPDRKETLLCVLELDKQHIAMAGLTNDGVGLFNLTYDGKTIVSDKSPLLPDLVAPEFIITDLQLVYWPVTVLQKRLHASSWRLECLIQIIVDYITRAKRRLKLIIYYLILSGLNRLN